MKLNYIIALFIFSLSSFAQMQSSATGENIIKAKGNDHMIQVAVASASNSTYRVKDQNNLTSNGIVAFLAYGQSLPMLKRLQILGRAGGSYSESDGWFRSSNLALGVGYNLYDDLNNSFFGNLLYQVQENKYSDGEFSENGYIVEIGKRFSLDFLGASFASFAPQISLDVSKGDGETITQYSLQLLKFDFFF